MDTAETKKKSDKLLGEWKFARNGLWLISILCMADALYVSGTDYQQFIRDGAFHSALIIGISGYLSELRYRFFEELRSN